MSSVNLKTDDWEMESGGSWVDKNIVIAFVVLILVFLLYGALWGVDKFLTSEIQKVHGQYAEKYNVFIAGNGNEIIDFENRSAVAKELMASEEPAVLAMGQIENTLVPPIYLTSYKYENGKKTITLEGMADNFNTIAKQILSFKESGYFSAVIAGPASFDKDNKLNFSINLVKK